MTQLEKKSARKCLALKGQVERGEKSPSLVLEELEKFNDDGKIIDIDYEPLAEYLEELINQPVKNVAEIIEEQTEQTENVLEVNE